MKVVVSIQSDLQFVVILESRILIIKYNYLWLNIFVYTAVLYTVGRYQ